MGEAKRRSKSDPLWGAKGRLARQRLWLKEAIESSEPGITFNIDQGTGGKHLVVWTPLNNLKDARMIEMVESCDFSKCRIIAWNQPPDTEILLVETPLDLLKHLLKEVETKPFDQALVEALKGVEPLILRQPYWTLSRVEQLVETAVKSHRDSVWLQAATLEDFEDLKQSVKGKRFALPLHCGCEVSNEYFIVEAAQ